MDYKFRGMTKEGKSIEGSLIQSKDVKHAFIGYAKPLEDGFPVIHYEEVLPETVELTQDINLEALCKQLAEALRESMQAVKIFHGEVAWEIYEQFAPEWQRWKATLEAAKKAGVIEP